MHIRGVTPRLPPPPTHPSAASTHRDRLQVARQAASPPAPSPRRRAKSPLHDELPRQNPQLRPSTFCYTPRRGRPGAALLREGVFAGQSRPSPTQNSAGASPGDRGERPALSGRRRVSAGGRVEDMAKFPVAPAALAAEGEESCAAPSGLMSGLTRRPCSRSTRQRPPSLRLGSCLLQAQTGSPPPLRQRGTASRRRRAGQGTPRFSWVSSRRSPSSPFSLGCRMSSTGAPFSRLSSLAGLRGGAVGPGWRGVRRRKPVGSDRLSALPRPDGSPSVAFGLLGCWDRSGGWASVGAGVE
jgi:hypothetical protein